MVGPPLALQEAEEVPEPPVSQLRRVVSERVPQPDEEPEEPVIPSCDRPEVGSGSGFRPDDLSPSVGEGSSSLGTGTTLGGDEGD